MKEKTRLEIVDLIIKGDLDSAITDLTTEYKPNDRTYKSFLVRYNKLKEERMRGLLSDEDYRVREAKITDQLLELLERKEVNTARTGRRVAVVLTVGVLFLMAAYFMFFKEKSYPLEFVGHLTSIKGMPLDDYFVEVKSSDNQTLNAGISRSDHKGVFVIKLTAPMSGTGWIETYPANCESPKTKLSIKKLNFVKSDNYNVELKINSDGC